MIYVFGGGNDLWNGSNTVEQYTISTNNWSLLNIKLPQIISYSISHKVSDSKIIVIGGSVVQGGKDIKKTANVFLFNFVGHKSVSQIKDASAPIFSIYPPFTVEGEDDILYIINEEEDNHYLKLFKFKIDNFVVRLKDAPNSK